MVLLKKLVGVKMNEMRLEMRTGIALQIHVEIYIYIYVYISLSSVRLNKPPKDLCLSLRSLTSFFGFLESKVIARSARERHRKFKRK